MLRSLSVKPSSAEAAVAGGGSDEAAAGGGSEERCLAFVHEVAFSDQATVEGGGSAEAGAVAGGGSAEAAGGSAEAAEGGARAYDDSELEMKVETWLTKFFAGPIDNCTFALLFNAMAQGDARVAASGREAVERALETMEAANKVVYRERRIHLI